MSVIGPEKKTTGAMEWLKSMVKEVIITMMIKDPRRLQIIIIIIMVIFRRALSVLQDHEGGG